MEPGGQAQRSGTNLNGELALGGRPTVSLKGRVAGIGCIQAAVNIPGPHVARAGSSHSGSI